MTVKLLLEHHTNFGDKQLVPAKVKNKAYTQMVRGKLFRIALRKLKDISAAEDAVQIAFEKAFRYQHTFNPDKEYDDWFGMILNNAIRDVGRDLRLQGMSLDDVDEDIPELETEELEHALSKAMDLRDINRIVSRIPKRPQAIIRLVIDHSTRPSDAARITGSSPQYVHKVLNQFVEQCHDMGR